MDVGTAGTSLKGPGAFTGPQAPQSAFNSNDVSSVDEKTGSTHALAAGETPVTLAQLHEVVKSHKEWVKLIIFDGDGNILLSNIKPLEGDVAYVTRGMCSECIFKTLCEL